MDGWMDGWKNAIQFNETKCNESIAGPGGSRHNSTSWTFLSVSVSLSLSECIHERATAVGMVALEGSVR